VSVEALRPDAWTRYALNPPRAHGAPLPPVAFKSTPEDFRVEEQLSFEPSGSGPHWLLRVEKRAANTRWVAGEIARLARVPVGDVGYAGLKDRQAVAVQWFSVPALATTAEFWSAVRTPEFAVLDVRANLRKLRRGALAGNRFRIRLRGVDWPMEPLEAKLATLRSQGAPNYFGPQRFGREGRNLDRLAAWVQGGMAPRGRGDRSFALSAARSLVFNALLARRVEAGDWARLAPGDLASLDGSGSHFAVSAVDDDLTRRLREFDIHPSGPLWGRGDPASGGLVLQHEIEVSREFSPVIELLAREGLTQERRALRCAIRELSVEREADAVTLSFSLGRSQYATAVLRELCDLQGVAELEADQDC
jgi:tRNA pseudouridine13 synthase